MAEQLILAPDYVLTGPDPDSLLPDFALLIQDGAVRGVGLLTDLIAAAPDAVVERLTDALVMPGLINAHQQGRATVALPSAPGDDLLEPSVMARLARTALDPYPLALMAAHDMLAHGVTTAVHAGAGQATGDYEGELRAAIQGYLEAGMRAVICVAAMDRCQWIAPPDDQADLFDGISPELKAFLDENAEPAYAGDLAATTALMDRLLADFGSHPRLTFRYAIHTPQFASDGLIRGLAKDAARRGLGLHIGVAASRADAAIAEAMFPAGLATHLDQLGALGPQTTLVHGTWLTERDIALIHQRGASLVVTAGSNLRMQHGVPPIGRILSAGVPLALGTNNRALADDEDLMAEMRLASGLARAIDHEWTERPTTADQLAMLGANGARAAGLSDRIGTLRPGFRADLVAVNLSNIQGAALDLHAGLLDNLLVRTGARDILFTMVGGKIRYTAGAVVGVDREAVAEQLRGSAAFSRAVADSRWPELWPELRAHLHRMVGGRIRAAVASGRLR